MVSTCSAAVLVVESPVPGGSFWWMASVVWSVTEPRKSVFSKVAAPSVATKTRRAIPNVIKGCRRPNRRIGK